MDNNTNIRLVKDETSAVIHGFEGLDYGGGPLTRQVSGVTALGDWDSKWTPVNREKIATVLDGCLADERVAIAETEKALAIIEA